MSEGDIEEARVDSCLYKILRKAAMWWTLVFILAVIGLIVGFRVNRRSL